MRIRGAVVVGLALIVHACGGGSSSPTMPSPVTPTPTPARYALSGTVSVDGGAGLAAATVTIADGADRGRQVQTDAGGRYQLANLTPGEFGVAVSADGYDAYQGRVQLAADRVVDVVLRRSLRAVLQVDQRIRWNGVAPDYATWEGDLDVSNTGDACAANVRVSAVLVDAGGADVVSVPMSLRVGSAVLRPGTSANYRGCCATSAELQRSAFFRTVITFDSLTCP